VIVLLVALAVFVIASTVTIVKYRIR
jgi:hypothetical protein